MKRIVSLVLFLAFAGLVSAQSAMASSDKDSNGKPHMAQRKFQILVENERNVQKVRDTNQRLLELQETSREEDRSILLASLLWTGISSSLKQKTVNATSNLVSLGLSYVTEALKNKQKEWYTRAKQQCFYNHSLSSESNIDDFYALPSTKGAMDPENLKFEGFGCKNYIELIDNPEEGVGVFYIFCKMRRDSIGLSHIVNHSKFLVEVDSLVFNPKYCNLPNDSTGSAESRFSFEKRDNLNLQLKVRLYSSWINQATMITNNQQLGEFTIDVDIDKNKLNSDSLFVYDKNDPDFHKLISVDGDCFIVPRSYTGTNNGTTYQPSWGTGQYRVEMEITERCGIVDSFYQIRESGNGKSVAYADATPGKKKWDKNKWKVEWTAMNSRKKGDSFFKNAWTCIVSAYKGTSWAATLTDPITTALYTWETQKLGNWIDDLYKSTFNEPAPTTSNKNNSATTTATTTQTSTNRIPSSLSGQSTK